MIFQLFYKSTSIKELTQYDLNDIVLNAIKKNSSLNITGCLVYFNNEFYQLLEGKQEDILSLYSSIENDKRHYHVTLLNQEQTKYRLFSNWNMALYLIDEKRNSERIVNEFKNKILLINSLNFSTDTALEFWYDVRKMISKKGVIDFNLVH